MQFAAVHFVPKMPHLRRVQLKIADVGRDADTGGAQAESAIELSDHFERFGARQHGDKAKSRWMLAADRGEAIVDQRAPRPHHARPPSRHSARPPRARPYRCRPHPWTQALCQVVLIRRHGHDMAAAIDQRLSARIVDEFEIGAVL